jgi:hypothetical protein
MVLIHLLYLLPLATTGDSTWVLLYKTPNQMSQLSLTVWPTHKKVSFFSLG